MVAMIGAKTERSAAPSLKGGEKNRVHPKFDLTSKFNNSGRVGPIYLKINDRIDHNSEPGHTKF